MQFSYGISLETKRRSAAHPQNFSAFVSDKSLEKMRVRSTLSGMKFLALIFLALAPAIHAAASVEGKVTLTGVRTAPPTARYQTSAPVGPPDPTAAIVYLE